MRLDEEQVERYSRQLVLPEIGPAGQVRLLAARVAIVGTGVAAERVLGYLAAAGVGHIAAPGALHAMADPAQTDVAITTLGRAVAIERFDIAVLADSADAGAPAARRAFWIGGGRAAERPPCPACAAAALPALPAVVPELRTLRDALLGTVIATEIVKGLLDLGTALRGHVLTYDPMTAALTTAVVPPRPGCVLCAGEAPEAW